MYRDDYTEISNDQSNSF